MLVLMRRSNQSIVIGNGVRVTVLAIDGERVKLGIEAPADVPIVREEILQAVGEANRGAVRATVEREELLRAVGARLPSCRNDPPGKRPECSDSASKGSAASFDTHSGRTEQEEAGRSPARAGDQVEPQAVPAPQHRAHAEPGMDSG